MELSGQLHTPAAGCLRKDYGTHGIGSWVHPRAILNILEKTTSLAFASIQTLQCPGHSLFASPARLSLFLFSSKYRNSDMQTILTVHMFLWLCKKHIIQCRDPEIQSKIQSYTLYPLNSLLRRGKSDILNHLQQLDMLRKKY
jgi:hypothetical protein